jgi:hypothetical protein
VGGREAAGKESVPEQQQQQQQHMHVVSVSSMISSTIYVLTLYRIVARCLVFNLQLNQPAFSRIYPPSFHLFCF